MKKSEAKKRIDSLRKSIEQHRYAYHVLDKTTISEAALDSLKHELYQLEQQYPECITPDSPTQRVGGAPLDAFVKHTHTHRMLSMEDVFSRNEFEAWVKRVQERAKTDLSFFCMPKLDGLAISLIYKDGLLETAATRGDGHIGENVTQNIRTITSIPLRLQEIEGKTIPETVEVRGEVYFPEDAFEALNKQMSEEGKPLYANPRNTAAGSVRQLDPAVTASRGLAFVAWDLYADLGQSSTSEEWSLLKALGFRSVPESVLCSTIEAVEKHWDTLISKRDSLGYWIDGMVVRVDNNEIYRKLGVVGKTPRGLVAWKFPAEEATAIVKDVHWQVGRTGALTPVAILEPTLIAGTTVQHASLHNMDEIERLDVRIGDTVILYKAGDIIPKVKEVLPELRPAGTRKTHAPTACPICGSEVMRKEGEVAVYCSNPRCLAQDREAVLHAARAFGIDGIGPSTIATLLEGQLIQGPADLFLLGEDEVAALEGFGELSAKKLIDEIQSKKTIRLDRFLVGLGIRHVGEQTARDLVKVFDSLEGLMEADEETLSQVDGIGPKVARAIVEYFAEDHHQLLIEAYLKHGVVIEAPETKSTPGTLDGTTFVLTGSLQTLSREQAKNLIQERGGTVSSSVSKKTGYVIVGTDPGSKFEKAKSLGVTILSEQEFLTLIS